MTRATHKSDGVFAEKRSHMLVRLASFGLLVLVSVSASATLSQRTFVSSTGSDAATCARNDPCRNFLAAVNAVAPGGEVVVLDSAGYGPVVLSKAVSIIAPGGVYAGVTAFSGATAIDITAGASDSITLRGLTLNGLSAEFGLHIVTAHDVLVSDCVITGFDHDTSAAGVAIVPSATTQVHLSQSVLKKNYNGLYAFSSTGISNVSISGVRIETNAGHGLSAEDGSSLMVSDSVASGNGGAGFNVFSGAAAAGMTVVHSVSSHNNSGFLSQGANTATLFVSGSTAAYNGTGFSTFGSGTFFSLGNNTVRANGSDNTVVATVVGPN
jgi:parallel beta helix pectate lyase-like protein